MRSDKFSVWWWCIFSLLDFKKGGLGFYRLIVNLVKCVIHVFQAVLTDKGICCSFNMKAAEERFLSKKYSTMLKMSQQSELSLAFYNTTLADATGDAKEPYPQASMNRILYYTLFKFSYNLF